MRDSIRGATTWLVVIIGLLTLAVPAQSVAAFSIGNAAFQATWGRTDKPVADGLAQRTWMWGPTALTGQPNNYITLREPYLESPGGWRTVQYFDKSRMEITQPNGDTSGTWYVTNGLLAEELITGEMQVGDATFEQHQPARINVAGDLGDPDSPTYATFNATRAAPPLADGAPITQRIDRNGRVTTDATLQRFGVIAAQRVTVPNLDHQIASPFWSFMTSVGSVYADGAYTTGPLFSDPFYATGLPITEAYWAMVAVSGVAQEVLVQCFERRCLTYTPDNPQGWQVEAGNVGQHYYLWRHQQEDAVRFVFDSGVSPSEQQAYRDAFAGARAFGGSVGDVMLYVSPDVNFILEHYADYFGIQLSDDTRQRWQTASAEASLGAVFVNTRTGPFSSGGLVHEYYHLLQNAHARQPIQEGPNDQVPIVGPVWLIEGEANAFSLYEQAAAGQVDVAGTRQFWLSQAQTFSQSLPDMERFAGTDPAQFGVLCSLAGDFMTQRFGAATLLAYWDAIGQGLAWRDAFTATFGLSVDEFYAQFSAYLHAQQSNAGQRSRE